MNAVSSSHQEIRDTIKLRQTRPFVAKNQGYLVPKKSVFNRIIGDSNLELRFAAFLEAGRLKMARLSQWCEDIKRVKKDVVYDFVYVDEESFEKYKPTSFQQLLGAFKGYKR
jgi:type III restriction enzyme